MATRDVLQITAHEILLPLLPDGPAEDYAAVGKDTEATEAAKAREAARDKEKEEAAKAANAVEAAREAEEKAALDKIAMEKEEAVRAVKAIEDEKAVREAEEKAALDKVTKETEEAAKVLAEDKAIKDAAAAAKRKKKADDDAAAPPPKRQIFPIEFELFVSHHLLKMVCSTEDNSLFDALMQFPDIVRTIYEKTAAQDDGGERTAAHLRRRVLGAIRQDRTLWSAICADGTFSSGVVQPDSLVGLLRRAILSTPSIEQCAAALDRLLENTRESEEICAFIAHLAACQITMYLPLDAVCAIYTPASEPFDTVVCVRRVPATKMITWPTQGVILVQNPKDFYDAVIPCGEVDEALRTTHVLGNDPFNVRFLWKLACAYIKANGDLGDDVFTRVLSTPIKFGFASFYFKPNSTMMIMRSGKRRPGVIYTSSYRGNDFEPFNSVDVHTHETVAYGVYTVPDACTVNIVRDGVVLDGDAVRYYGNDVWGMAKTADLKNTDVITAGPVVGETAVDETGPVADLPLDAAAAITKYIEQYVRNACLADIAFAFNVTTTLGFSGRAAFTFRQPTD